MANIEQIDTTQPLSFDGNRTTISDEPELIALAERHENERMRYVSAPITERIELTPNDVKILLDYVGGCRWREDFDKNLQGLAQTHDGHPLLTGWMSLPNFLHFVADAALDNRPTREILDRLKMATVDWVQLGVEEVYFHGHDLYNG